MSGKIRLNFDVGPEIKDRLDRLVETTDAVSMSEVLRRALSLYELVSSVIVDGGSVTLRHKDGKTETVKLLL